MSCLPRVARAALSSAEHDCLVLVASKPSGPHPALAAALQPALQLDQAAEAGGCVVGVSLPAGRLVYSPTGPLDRDYDDLRRFTDAGAAGVKRAVAAGAKRPLVVVEGELPGGNKEEAELAALLGALQALYTPLEMREAVAEKTLKVSELGWAGAESVLQRALAIERGRIVARDVGGSDPERMAAPRVEEYVREAFKGDKKMIVFREDILI